jgi:hypothetical protein
MGVRNLGKTIAISIAALLATAIFCAAAFVQFQQNLLRWRAERLLTDIHSIQMGKSNWQDAQRLMTRWGRWGDWQGECSARRCDYQIVMEDAFHVMPIYQMPNGGIREEANQRFKFLGRPYTWLGGRFAMVAARIQLKDGIIWTKNFEVLIPPLPHIPYQFDTDAVIAGWTHGVTSGRHCDLPGLSEYAVERPICSGCKALEVSHTPFADPILINHLLEFHLKCLTSFRPCLDPSQLMPNAEGFLKREEQQPGSIEPPELSADQELELEARDTQYVALAEITGTSTTIEDGKNAEWATFRLTQSLKGAVPAGLKVNRPQPATLLEVAWRESGSSAKFRVGEKAIALFDVRPDRPEQDNINNGDYTLIPYKDQALAAVQRGIARDKLADVP